MKKRLLLFTFIVIIVLIFSPYLKAEILTLRFGKTFKHEYLQTNMIDSIQYFKVLDKKKDTAKVLYITSKHASANIVYFKYLDGKWCMTNWVTVWSKSGSADSFIWPYYP